MDDKQDAIKQQQQKEGHLQMDSACGEEERNGDLKGDTTNGAEALRLEGVPATEPVVGDSACGLRELLLKGLGVVEMSVGCLDVSDEGLKSSSVCFIAFSYRWHKHFGRSPPPLRHRCLPIWTREMLFAWTEQTWTQGELLWCFWQQ